MGGESCGWVTRCGEWGLQLSSLEGVWGGPLMPGRGEGLGRAEKTPAPTPSLQWGVLPRFLGPRGGQRKRLLIQVGNSGCGGEA